MYELHIDLDLDGDVVVKTDKVEVVTEVAKMIDLWKADRDNATLKTLEVDEGEDEDEDEDE